MVDNSWAWWAGRDEEWLTIGPCQTRDDAIAEAINDFGEGEGDFVVMEAVMQTLRLRADSFLERLYEEWADCGDFFSLEHDSPEPQGSKEDQKTSEDELQALLDAWFAKWEHTFPKPNMFASTRNVETVRNTIDPDMLPGGHDNPREAA